MTDLNPQAKQTADESMVRNLEAQACHLAAGNSADPTLQAATSAAHFGCRLRQGRRRLEASAALYGCDRDRVDIIDAHLDVARSRYADLGPRLSFEHQSIYELKDGDGAFDLTSAATCFTRYRSRSE